MGLNRRQFIGTTGALGAQKLIGRTADAHSGAPPNRYRLLWVEPEASGRSPIGTRGYALNNAGQLTGDYRVSASSPLAPFLFRPNLDGTVGEFVDLASLLPQGTTDFLLAGPAAINDDGVLAGGAVRRVRGVDMNFAYRIHPPSVFGAGWRFEKGPDLDFGDTAADFRLSNVGDVVFCSSGPESGGATARTRLNVWLPGASNYIDLDVGPSVDERLRPTGCCRVGNAVLVGVFGGDSVRMRGHRLDYDVVTGQTRFHRLPNAAIQPGALGMNARGDVVGSYLAQATEGVVERGFQRTAEPWTLTLGALGGERSAAFSVNSKGEMVGHAEHPLDRGTKTQTTAFLCKAFQMCGLAPLIDGGAPAALSTAQLLINDQGLIAGNVDGPYAAARDNERAFILFPSRLHG